MSGLKSECECLINFNFNQTERDTHYTDTCNQINNRFVYESCVSKSSLDFD